MRPIAPARFVIRLRTTRGIVFHSAYGWVGQSSHATLYGDEKAAHRAVERMTADGRDPEVVGM